MRVTGGVATERAGRAGVAHGLDALEIERFDGRGVLEHLVELSGERQALLAGERQTREARDVFDRLDRDPGHGDVL